MLFPRSLRHNLCYGCASTPTQQQLEQAVLDSGSAAIVAALPEGLDTMVDTCSLSGGEKQRLAIARALLRQPRLLLLDEATSALDGENSQLVWSGLQRLMRHSGCSTVMIAHKQSAMRRADVVFCIQEGRVVKSCTPDELFGPDETQLDELGALMRKLSN